MNTFNRPFSGFLDNKEVTVYSFDIIDKIKQNNIEPEYKFIFETDENTEKSIYQKSKNNSKINFKIIEGCKLEAYLYLKFSFGIECPKNKYKDEYKILKLERVD